MLIGDVLKVDPLAKPIGSAVSNWPVNQRFEVKRTVEGEKVFMKTACRGADIVAGLKVSEVSGNHYGLFGAVVRMIEGIGSSISDSIALASMFADPSPSGVFDALRDLPSTPMIE